LRFKKIALPLDTARAVGLRPARLIPRDLRCPRPTPIPRRPGAQGAVSAVSSANLRPAAVLAGADVHWALPAGGQSGAAPHCGDPENRRRHISDDLAAAENLKQQASAALAAYEKALADARDRAHTIASETHHQLMIEIETRRRLLEDS